MRAGIVIFVALLLFGFSTIAFAQNSTESGRVDYDLPYPGILPDSPLYNLKTFRDKVVSLFISDPTKKAEFDLLTADKRLGAAIILYEKGKKELAETTISKGENYFEDAIENLKLSRTQGRPIDVGLMTNMELSSKKHKEALTQMAGRTSGGLKERFLKDLERAEKFILEVMELKADLEPNLSN